MITLLKEIILDFQGVNPPVGISRHGELLAAKADELPILKLPPPYALLG